jgi:hypothetical protein
MRSTTQRSYGKTSKASAVVVCKVDPADEAAEQAASKLRSAARGGEGTIVPREDRFRNEFVYALEGMFFYVTTDHGVILELEAIVEVDGQRIEPDEVRIVLSLERTPAPERYEGCRDIEFAVDDRPPLVVDASYSVSRVTANLSVADLAGLMTGRNIVGRVCRDKFTFDRAQIQRLVSLHRVVLSYTEHLAPEQP